MEVLGNMTCTLDASYIQNSDPFILEKLKVCRDFSDGQVAAMETLLLSGTTQYGYDNPFKSYDTSGGMINTSTSVKWSLIVQELLPLLNCLVRFFYSHPKELLNQGLLIWICENSNPKLWLQRTIKLQFQKIYKRKN